MFTFNTNKIKKLICVLVIFFVSAQSMLYAAKANTNYLNQALGISDYCDQVMGDPIQRVPDCCDKAAIDYAHCNNCYATAVAMLPTDLPLSAADHSNFNQSSPADLNYLQPVIEQFKPPI